MARKKLTKKNAEQVMRAVLKLDKEQRDEILKKWNDVLDELRWDDFFGTEAQNDPRGDGRED